MSEKENIPEQDQHRAELIAEIEHHKQKLASGRQRLLPGIALIGIWMLVLAIFGVFGALQGKFPGAGANYAVLAICTMIVVGVFGMLGLRRWGWALVLGAAALASAVYIYNAVQLHMVPLYVMAALHLFFFLYLVRPEVRERMR